MENGKSVELACIAVAGDTLAALFHALSEPTRLAVLEHLSRGEHRVRDIVEHMNLAQSTVSKHLACLRDCGLVTVRIEGRASWYSIANEEQLLTLLASADKLLAHSGVSISLQEHQIHNHEQTCREVGPS